MLHLARMIRKTLVALIVAGVFPLAAVNAAAPVVSLDEQIRQTAELARQLESRNQLIADLQIQVTALQEEMRQLHGQLEEQDYKISQMQDRQRDLYADLDQRLSETLAKSNTSVYGGTVVGSDTASTATPEAPIAGATETAKVVETVKPKPVKSGFTEESEQQAYDAVFPLVSAKKFIEALQAYDDFLIRFPGGKNSVNARYWIGQIHYVQNELDEAEAQFKQIAKDYRDYSRLHEVLYKLGEIALKRGDNANARTYFQKVVKQFPESRSARPAQQRLQEIK